jgi:hypothetical protein
MKKNKLSVFLKGERDYVQGTQIISRLSEVLPSEEQFFLESASFNKITNKYIFFVDNDNFSHLKNNLLGYVIFKPVSKKGNIKYVFFEDTDHIAPFVEDHEIDLKYNFVSKHDLSANINFTVLNNFEAILESIIYFVKKLHTEHKENISNVWFSAINKATIPLTNNNKIIQAELVIINLMNKKISNKFLTLSNVAFNSSELNFTCNLTFAYDSL